MDVSMFCFVYLYPNEVGLVPDFRPLGLGFFPGWTKSQSSYVHDMYIHTFMLT